MALSMPFSSSWANMLPIVLSDAEIYRRMCFFPFGGVRIGGHVKYCFIWSKASWCSARHSNFPCLSRSRGEKAWVRPLKLEINLLKKFILPNNDCNSFFVDGDLVSIMTFVLFWLISIPFLWTTKPKKSPACTKKAHLRGFIFKPYFLILSNDWLR